jgi:hypothetical protein
MQALQYGEAYTKLGGPQHAAVANVCTRSRCATTRTHPRQHTPTVPRYPHGWARAHNFARSLKGAGAVHRARKQAHKGQPTPAPAGFGAAGSRGAPGNRASLHTVRATAGRGGHSPKLVTLGACGGQPEGTTSSGRDVGEHGSDGKRGWKSERGGGTAGRPGGRAGGMTSGGGTAMGQPSAEPPQRANAHTPEYKLASVSFEKMVLSVAETCARAWGRPTWRF